MMVRNGELFREGTVIVPLCCFREFHSINLKILDNLILIDVDLMWEGMEKTD